MQPSEEITPFLRGNYLYMYSLIDSRVVMINTNHIVSISYASIGTVHITCVNKAHTCSGDFDYIQKLLTS